MWPIRTTDQKEENIDTIARSAIIGIDVSRDWLDSHCLPHGQRLRLANTIEGHQKVVELARQQSALVCFEATGGQDWRLRSALDTEGIATSADQSLCGKSGHAGQD